MKVNAVMLRDSEEGRLTPLVLDLVSRDLEAHDEPAGVNRPSLYLF